MPYNPYVQQVLECVSDFNKILVQVRLNSTCVELHRERGFPGMNKNSKAVQNPKSRSKSKKQIKI